MLHWSLDLDLRQKLLELWIMPLLIAPARVIFPTKEVIASVRTIYNTALKTNSWGLTHTILSQPLDLGGLGLVPPSTFLYWQHGAAFASMAAGAHSFSDVSLNAYKEWAEPLGVIVNRSSTPFFQLGKVPLDSPPFIAQSARAFSMARRGSEFTPPPVFPMDMPLWHNIIFCHPGAMTYFSPKLV